MKVGAGCGPGSPFLARYRALLQYYLAPCDNKGHPIMRLAIRILRVLSVLRGTL